MAESYSDCQDYFGVNVKNKKIAISDGMSQSIFPFEWARILVEFYLATDKIKLTEDLQPLKVEWSKYVDNELKRQKKAGMSTWMLENFLTERKGAAATFCGVKFSGYEWYGQVLGDSCLIEINENNQIINIYTSQTGDFGNHPDYFDSINNGRGIPKSINGILKKGWKLLFVTDPFAELLYIKRKDNIEIDFIAELLQISSQEDFECLVDKWRRYENMHNDDSTIIIVEHDGNEEFKINENTRTIE